MYYDRNVHLCWLGMRNGAFTMKTVWQFLMKLEMPLPCKPLIIFLGLFSKLVWKPCPHKYPHINNYKTFTHTVSKLFFFFFLLALWFELRTMHLLAKQALHHSSHTPSPFWFTLFFQIGSPSFAWGWPQRKIPIPLLPTGLVLFEIGSH
jgi:hypothetical protein